MRYWVFIAGKLGYGGAAAHLLPSWALAAPSIKRYSLICRAMNKIAARLSRFPQKAETPTRPDPPPCLAAMLSSADRNDFLAGKGQTKVQF